jgi:predicted Na+-dependent transporter
MCLTTRILSKYPNRWGVKQGDLMGRYSFVTIIMILGISIGASIGIYLDFYKIVTVPLFAGIFGVIFFIIGSYLNSIGVLINIFQFINLLIGLVLYYLLFFLITYMVSFWFGYEDPTKYKYMAIVPIPFAFLMVARYIRKNKINFRRASDITEDNIY